MIIQIQDKNPVYVTMILLNSTYGVCKFFQLKPIINHSHQLAFAMLAVAGLVGRGLVSVGEVIWAIGLARAGRYSGLGPGWADMRLMGRYG